SSTFAVCLTYCCRLRFSCLFPATSPLDFSPLSLHDALPIWYFGAMLAYGVGYTITEIAGPQGWRWTLASAGVLSAIVLALRHGRSEEHTSELQSRFDLVCRLLLEKKKRTRTNSAWRRE